MRLQRQTQRGSRHILVWSKEQSRFLAFLAALFVAVGVAAGRPAVTGVRADEALWPVGPVITSKAAMVIEADTGVVLYKSDAYTAYQPANISQIMTSLIVIERF